MGSRVSHDSRLEGHLDVATNPAKATWGGGVPAYGREEKRPQSTQASTPQGLTLRSVLRIQMKVQTRGLLADLSTTKPPGPFSPLRREVSQGRVAKQSTTLGYPHSMLGPAGLW